MCMWVLYITHAHTIKIKLWLAFNVVRPRNSEWRSGFTPHRDETFKRTKSNKYTQTNL